MALKIVLKPHEKMILAGAAITNGPATSTFLIENEVPLLRQKDILAESQADSPARRIYYVVQLMYIDRAKLLDYHATYWKLVRDFLGAAPSSLKLIDGISEHIVAERYYQALKTSRKLVEYEKTLLEASG